VALLETIRDDVKKCPICDAPDSLKISGFRRSSLECTHCNAQWSAGVFEDTGSKWLMLTKPANTNVGAAKAGLLYRQAPLDFWLNKNKPFLKLERYAEAIYDAFKDFETLKKEFGEAEFKVGRDGIWFIGPSIHIVATMHISWEKKEDYDLSIAVVDQTPLLKEKDKEKDSLFCYMIRKKLQILSEETGIPITPYLIRSEKEGGSEVKENAFYPFKDLEELGVVLPAGTPKWHRNVLIAYSLMEPNKEKTKLFEAKPVPEAKPVAKKTEAQPATKPPQKAQIAKPQRVSRENKCVRCGSLIPQGARVCPNCEKAAGSIDTWRLTTYIDEFHKERTALNDFKTFKAQLKEQGKVLVRSKKPLTASSLRAQGLLVIGGPEHPWMFGRGGDKWSSKEVKAIQRFVARGGALLMMGDSLGSAEEMSVVTAPYGIAFSGDSVGDVTLSKNDITAHPLTEAVNEICLGSVIKSGGKYLDVTEPAVVIARHEGRPVLAYSEHELGRVAVLSSLSAFSNKYIEREDNLTLLKNLLKYLPNASLAMGVRLAAEKTQPPPAPEPVELQTPAPEAAPRLLIALFCPQCGFTVAPGAVFCGDCGNRLEIPSETIEPIMEQPRSESPEKPPSWTAALTSWVDLSDEWDAFNELFQEDTEKTADATFPRDRTALMQAWERDIKHWQPTFLKYREKEIQLWDRIKKAPDLPEGAFSLIHTIQVNCSLAYSRRQELLNLLKKQLSAMRARDQRRVNALFAEVLQWIKAQNLLRNDYAHLLQALRETGVPIPPRHIPKIRVIRDEDYEIGKHIIRRLVPVLMPSMAGHANPWMAEYEDWLQNRRAADAKLEELQRYANTADWYLSTMNELKEARYRAASY
jgi:hypothetical protein